MGKTISPQAFEDYQRALRAIHDDHRNLYELTPLTTCENCGAKYARRGKAECPLCGAK